MIKQTKGVKQGEWTCLSLISSHAVQVSTHKLLPDWNDNPDDKPFSIPLKGLHFILYYIKYFKQRSLQIQLKPECLAVQFLGAYS